MKKKKLLVALSFVVALSLSACSGTPAPATDPDETKPSEPTATQQSQETEESTESKGTSYEVTYQNVSAYTDSIGTTWVQAIVEITNTGSENLYLNSGSYDLEDAEGDLITSQSLVSTYPDVLAPGEKGYMYDETTLDDYEEGAELKILPKLDIEKAKVGLIRYNVSDVKVSDDDMGDIKVLGRVENTTNEASSMVYIVAFFYDADGTPIGSAFTILDGELEVGEKTGFEIHSFALPDDVSSDKIAETVVYAYPSQFQF